MTALNTEIRESTAKMRELTDEELSEVYGGVSDPDEFRRQSLPLLSLAIPSFGSR